MMILVNSNFQGYYKGENIRIENTIQNNIISVSGRGKSIYTFQYIFAVKNYTFQYKFAVKNYTFQLKQPNKLAKKLLKTIKKGS